jgi:hypothetical protein
VSKLQEPKSGWYSGRTTGVPVAGAIGGGDDFAQRIAKPYVPGKPSQGGMSTSADTTFSLMMGQSVPDPEIDHMTDFNPEEIAPGKVLQRPVPRGLKMSKKYFHRKLSEVLETLENDDLSWHEMFEDDLRDEDDVVDEFSGVGAIAGYVEPLHGPVGDKSDKKRFYDRMAKPYGAKYLVDPVKATKARP